MSEADPGLRIDKWLWRARFFKSRTLATAFCGSGRLRLNGDLSHKAHATVRPGDVLTFPLGPRIRVVRVIALGTRRGPAPEARSLYEDLAPPDMARQAPAEAPPPAAARDRGSGRPTKAERRALDRWRHDAG